MAASLPTPEPDAVTLTEMIEGLDVDESKLTPEFKAWLKRQRRVTKVTKRRRG